MNEPAAIWDESEYLVEHNFGDLLKERQTIQRRINEDTERRKNLDLELGALLAVSGLKTVICGGMTATTSTRTNARFDKTAFKQFLLQKGVDAGLIHEAEELATTVGDPVPVFTVREGRV